MVKLIEAGYVMNCIVRLRFDDGATGEIDLSDRLYGPVFEPLQDSEYFQTFQVHPELHTLVWPNGADVASEFLHDRVRVPV